MDMFTIERMNIYIYIYIYWNGIGANLVDMFIEGAVMQQTVNEIEIEIFYKEKEGYLG